MAEAVIFLPMITLAVVMTGDASLLIQAGLITGAMVLGITVVALDDEEGFQLSSAAFSRSAGLSRSV